MHEFDTKYVKAAAVIIVSVLAGILIVACTSTAPTASDNSNSPSNVSANDPSSNSIGNVTMEESPSNLQEFAAESEYVTYDESRHTAFYNNRIVVVMERGSYNEIGAIAREYNADIADDMGDIGIYVLILPHTYSYDQLDKMTQELEESSYVDYATIDEISEIGNDQYD